MNQSKEIHALHADFCKLLANPKRIEIVFLLDQKELCVEEIATAMEVKVPNISQHLAVLREKGVVEVRKEGTRAYYKLSNDKMLQACRLMRQAMIDQMEKQLDLVKDISNQ
jgi:ArsR family transcriptional regulator